MSDRIDAAIAKANAPRPEARMKLLIKLSNLRIVELEVPIPMAAEEILELLISLPGFIGQANEQVMRGPGIQLPNGQVVPVLPAAPEAPKES